jgi:VWFA-related protein
VLDTVVTDRDDKIVRGLTKDDFTVYENGVPQTIRNFTSVEEQPAVPAAPVTDRNGHEQWGNSPLTMIVVDGMDTPFEEQAYSRECVRKFLKAQPEQMATPTILLWLNDYGVHPLTGFTRDRQALMTALEKQPPVLPGKLMRGAAVEQVAAAFAALQQAALFSRGAPGKKEIIWVGRSFPSINPIGLTDYDRTLLTKAVRSTADMLLASRVTLYVVDPTITNSSLGDDTQEDADTLQFDTSSTVKDPFESNFNIDLFVKETGGRYFRGRNDLDRLIADSEQRGLAYYTLTYVPSSPIQDGSYRKIVVGMRNPDLIAQTKKGYYSEAEPASAPTKQEASLDEKDLRFDLFEAVVTGMQYTGLGLHVVSCARDAAGEASCIVSVDTGGLTFTPYSASEERTTLMSVMAALDAKGRIVNNRITELTIGIPETQMAKVAGGATKIRFHTIVPPAAKSIRMVVRDASGRIGTADVPADVVPQLVDSSWGKQLRK